MRFTNATAWVSGWTLGFERDGRERLVVVSKASYRLPRDGETPQLLPQAVALVTADVHHGDPATTAPLHETDFAQTKPGCDVLLVGSAWARNGRPAPRVPVLLRVGRMEKMLTVTGPRQWQGRWTGTQAGDPAPFVQQPFSYDQAFGGRQLAEDGQTAVGQCDRNPVGVGFSLSPGQLDGQPMPITEEVEHPITSARNDWRPMAFGPIGRHWLPRRQYGGTYDEAWQRARAPFWPDDFDDRYFQSAPPDQVIDPPSGNEEVVLQNLTPDGLRRFRLPETRVPVLFIPHRGRDYRMDARLDTVVFEPDAERFTLTWRATLPLANSVFDVKEVIVGEMPQAWHRARRFPGKTYYASLGALVAQRRRTGRL
ncbi:DUF2169 family type VI secretion system accessory protein [Roseateles terrae]|uniref:DUF2169 domain-containing protein n=1 Tax=Roseateles terrae TaxID=431060 RepID=A0ABR6GXB6_9BURK|nr:DUF2169 domain-containing protein [Roseateles terrae]MBB3196751.1 hypothetical protein [Roseateles terrae]OWQ84986.1 hypothetical protein CDN98_18255 [Roseateles terrae]